jgi:thiamine-monophosphate kinase
MTLSEFSLIERFFTQPKLNHPHNQLGVGDDCALLSVPTGYQLAVTTDTMVENVHFFAGANPRQLGHKLLAVNLSDLASMGAEPVAVTLALTLPSVDEQWLREFAHGFLTLATQYNVDLIGGDTTQGALTLTVQALGFVPQGQALLRSAAKVGDVIYVTGTLGDAGLGLKIAQGYSCAEPDLPLTQFHTPQPQIAAGLRLRKIAHACIDISDGLAADLGHILEKSQVGATLDFSQLPLSNPVQAYIAETGDWHLPLVAGDDYHLCFTVPPERVPFLDFPCHPIGVIEAKKGLRIKHLEKIHCLQSKGYEHFS